jgi:hypothetical protein
MTQRVYYTVDLSPEAWVALKRHGYNPALPPRGVSGPPGEFGGFTMGFVGGEPFRFPMRNRVCELDGVAVDGHEGSDLDPGSTSCIHCGYQGPRP